jgi:hypothetical protein
VELRSPCAALWDNPLDCDEYLQKRGSIPIISTGGSMTAPRYRIKSVGDFLAVPVDKRGDCLKDFAFWLSMADKKDAIDKALIGLFGIPDDSTPLSITTFVWVDDGIEGISSVEIVVKEAV